jgi:KUP system potassium uptake protein
MTEVLPAPPQSGSCGCAGDAWRDLGHRMRLVLADRIAPPSFNTLATPGGSRLSAESRLAVAALGVVYGDIGTSPLYAFRQSLVNFGDVSERAILGTVSLIVWALMLVVTVKYVLVIMRADNRGEGGLLALTALVLRSTSSPGRRYFWIMAAGMVGAALFYGDGAITPAISVLSAVEGLKMATPLFEPYIVPISLVLLIGLFLVQRRGTAAIGRPFGPVMLVWFAVLGLLGVWGIVQHPRILLALDPTRAIALLFDAPWRGFVMLGSVFLAVTGAEALYADVGHFGRKAIRTAWLKLVFPALLLNYFGQGALLLGNPGALDHPFYRLAPEWSFYPLVALSTAATIIASQAVISGAFSMTRQAIQLGYLPRLEVRHTSAEEIGQVYAPRINGLFLIVIIILVLGFRSSDNLGAAYGIAVSGMMAITTGLAFLYMRSRGWSLAIAVPVFAAFGLIDLTFLSSNLLKIFDGGWFPIAVAAVVFTMMATWWRGRRLLAQRRARDAMELSQFIAALDPEGPPRIEGIAIFLTSDLTRVPTALLRALEHYKGLHQRVIMMQVDTEDVAHVPDEQRLEIAELGKGFYTIRLRYGFMDEPNILRALAQCRAGGLHVNLTETSFIIRRERLRVRPHARRTRWWRWRNALFVFMSNNTPDATEFFWLPPDRVVELGGQVAI